MAVQDNSRERELCRLFNLTWDAAHMRSGVDAVLETTIDGVQYEFDVEVKSTTNDTVSTARDVGPSHISRWRKMFFVVGFYSRNPVELTNSLCLTPVDLEPWIAGIEAYIRPDLMLAERAASKLDVSDLSAVCGAKPYYSAADAKRLHKCAFH